MKIFCGGLILSCLLCCVLPARPQVNTYIRNGSATQDNCNCYTLTKASNNQSGSVWNASQIDLQQPFNFSFNVFLGCKDSDGADGIVFILQTVATSVGAPGGGMGFDGVTPSVGIALDTWQNFEFNDPPFDHISIQTNGRTNHSFDLAGPVSILTNGANIEDCKWHVFRIDWNPATQLLQAWFDDSLRVSKQVDLIGTVFNNNPGVYWGFSAATGGANNLQQFCTALNPGFTTNLTNNATCIGSGPVIFTNTSVSFAPVSNFYWDFGDGSSSTDANPSPHIYRNPGLYKVKLAITGLDGCQSDTLEKTIAVGDHPIARFQVFDTCSGNAPRIVEQSSTSTGTITQWHWSLNGNNLATLRAGLDNLSPGNYTLQLVAESNYGCMSQPEQNKFTVKPVPLIEAIHKGACIKERILFNGAQLDNATQVNRWAWDFGNGRSSTTKEATFIYTQAGKYIVQLNAVASNGCSAMTDTIQLVINQAIADAGNDTVIIKGKPIQLHGSGGGDYSWTPVQAFIEPHAANPYVDPDDDITYRLVVTSPQGCTDDDIVTITVFKGSEILVPTAFSPNNDGLNEELRPQYKGIKSLGHFMVYNRWGQLLFSTNNPGLGWDGTINGVKQGSGVYVWRVGATDYTGKVYELSGTVTLIR